MKKQIKKGILAAVVPVAVIAVAAGAFLGIPYLKLMTADTSGTAFQNKYKLDTSGNYIANIPREKYLTYSSHKENEKIFDIRSYGASTTADFKTNREAINKAIAEASKSGGGIVVVDGGEYICSNIKLQSNVTLRIEKDSALTNITYDCDKNENQEFHSVEENNTIERNALIYAEKAENITIEGPGKLKGNGTTYCKPQEDSSLFYPLDTFNLKVYVTEHRKRIMMGKEHEMSRDFIMAVNYCKNVTVKNLEIYESGSWTCRMEGNDGLTFDGVIINNNIRVANSDGIDIMGGKNTVIKNCFIATGDDALCLKTDPDNEPVENVLIENCEVMSLANCFKIGTATHKDISDVTVRNCYFFMPGIAGGYAGIAIEATDGGKVSDITVENIDMENVTTPFMVWLGYREEGSRLENIKISNITASGCDIASSVTGYKRGGEVSSVKNVLIENVDVKYREAKEKTNIFLGNGAYEGKLNMGGYPESTRISHMYILNHTVSPYFDIPVYGLFARNVDGLTVKNFTVTPRSTNQRPFTNFDDKEKYNIDNLQYI